MKHELEKITGTMEAEAERVKQNVNKRLHTNAVNKQEYSIAKWILTPVLTLFCIGFIGYFMMNKSEVTAIPQGENMALAALDDMTFEILVIEHQYLKGQFKTKQQAKLDALNEYKQLNAVISYGISLGVAVSEMDMLKVKTGVAEQVDSWYTDSVYENEVLKAKIQTLGLTMDEFMERLVHTKIYFEAMLFEVLAKDNSSAVINDVNAFIEKCIAYYEQHGKQEIEDFQRKHHIIPVQSKKLEQFLGWENLFLSAFNKELYRVGVNKKGQLEFLEPNVELYKIEAEYEDVFKMVQRRLNIDESWSPLTHPIYVLEVNKISSSSKDEIYQRANEVLNIFKILEHTFVDDYDYFPLISANE